MRYLIATNRHGDRFWCPQTTEEYFVCGACVRRCFERARGDARKARPMSADNVNRKLTERRSKCPSCQATLSIEEHDRIPSDLQCMTVSAWMRLPYGTGRRPRTSRK